MKTIRDVEAKVREMVRREGLDPQREAEGLNRIIGEAIAEHERLAVRGAAEAVPAPGDGVQLLVCDTDDEARVLAAAVAVAGSGEGLTVLARRAGRAAIELRTLALDGPDAEADAVAAALDAALRPDDELVTVILGRDAMPDVGALAAEAVARYGERTLGDPDAIEVVIHAGAQARPDVLMALE